MATGLHYLTGILGLLGIKCLRWQYPQYKWRQPGHVYCGWDLSDCRDNVYQYKHRLATRDRILKEHFPQELAPDLQKMMRQGCESKLSCQTILHK